MGVSYVGESQAKPDEIASFRDFMTSVVIPLVVASEGCESCQLLQSHDDPARFIVIEQWTSVEAHKAAAKTISQEAIADYMKLVARPPTGSYFSML